MRYVLLRKPYGKVYFLGAAGGVFEALDQAVERNAGNQMGLLSILLLCLIGGAIGGIIGLWLVAGLIKLTGKLFKGKATYSQVMAAAGWASVPAIWGGLLWIPELLVFGQNAFMPGAVRSLSGGDMPILYQVLHLLRYITSIWSFIVLLKCVSEVEGYSAWKALLTLLIPIVVIVVLVVIIGMATVFEM